MNCEPSYPGRKRRQAILDFLREYQTEHKRPPTGLEISEAVGGTMSNAFAQLKVLEREGKVKHKPDSRRSYSLPEFDFKEPQRKRHKNPLLRRVLLNHIQSMRAGQ